MSKSKPDLTQSLLIVDDEEAILKLFSAFFEERSFTATCVGSLEEAERALQETSFDVALIDVRLPDGDGVEFLSRIKSRYVDLTVIVMTGLGYDDETLARALRAGADGYLSKMMPLDQALMEVHRAVASRNSKRRAEKGSGFTE